MTQHSILTAGIDAAKDKLDVALHGRDRVVTFDNTDPGIAKLADYLKAEAAGRVGIEATGGYERAAVRYLQAQGLSSPCCSRCRSAPSPSCVCSAPKTTASTPG